jgi:hypothetical protein
MGKRVLGWGGGAGVAVGAGVAEEGGDGAGVSSVRVAQMVTWSWSWRDVAFSLGLSANPPTPDSAAITTRAIDSWCLPAAS